MSTPFVVLSLPRSRSTWLSRFLSYRDWHCGHEEIRHFRGLADVRSWLAQPNTGTAETNGAWWWRLLNDYRPDARVVTIRRPFDEVVDSVMALDIGFDRVAIGERLRRLDAKLDQVEARMSKVLSLRYHDLDEAGCGKIFEFCLPYKHDRAWWRSLSGQNIQSSVFALVRYVEAHGEQLAKIETQAKHAMLTKLRLQPIADVGGVTLQCEPFDVFYRDGQQLFAEHLTQVDESPDAFSRKNVDLMRTLDHAGIMQIVTARMNGRMFGYLMSILSPSLEHKDVMTAVHTTFFAAKEVPGLGLRLQRYAIQALRARGVGEVYFRAGPRGSGPKMGALYRRLGAEAAGELYQMPLAG